MSVQTPVYISNSVYSALYQLSLRAFLMTGIVQLKGQKHSSQITLLSAVENQRPDYGSVYAKFEILSTIHITSNKSGYV